MILIKDRMIIHKPIDVESGRPEADAQDRDASSVLDEEMQGDDRCTIAGFEVSGPEIPNEEEDQRDAEKCRDPCAISSW